LKTKNLSATWRLAIVENGRRPQSIGILKKAGIKSAKCLPDSRRAKVKSIESLVAQTLLPSLP
jgi:hypothetical protein